MCGRGLLRSRFGGWAETQRWGGIREVETFCGGTEQKHIRGNSKSPRRYKGGWLFIIIRYYAKKNFSHNIYYDIIAARSCILFVWVVGWGMRFRTPPKCADAVYCVRALGGGRKRIGGMAVCLKGSDSKSTFSFILFVRVVGWGMCFRTPPKCADAVHCVRALGGGRKRRGGMAVCLKGPDSKKRKPLGDKQSCWGLVPEQTPLF